MNIKLVNENFKDNYVENLLRHYGVVNIEEYIHPTTLAIQDPAAFDNIHEGALLLKEVCDNNGKILLIVDCDTDGFTSAAIFYQYIKKIYPNIEIDYRLHEGKQHGLEDQIDWIEQNPLYSLIVLPDSSSNDKEYHDRLLQYGIKCLVLDHHETDVEISENAVVINNQMSSNYRNKGLTGAGVVYQFCRYLDNLFGVNYADDFIDLAALGIDGDMGSLLDIENRYIISKGFENIQNFFFQVLIDKQSYSMGGAVNPISVAFYIVPLINAMIRVGTMEEKNRLFQAFIDGKSLVPSNKRGAKGTMEMVAIESARECTNARSHQNKFKEGAVLALEEKIENEGLLDNKILFVKLDDDMEFPSELNGLVCMQLSQKYQRPTLLGRENKDGEIKGSIRGLNNSALASLKNFLVDSGLFEYVQGHANAAGYSILNQNLDSFHKYANEELKYINFEDTYYNVNFVRNADDYDIKDIITDVCQYKDVWGTDVPEPFININNIKIKTRDIQIMGKNQDTVKIMKNDIAYMKFRAKDMIDELAQYDGDIILDVIGRCNINEWMGRQTCQIFIEDYSIRKNSILDF